MSIVLLCVFTFLCLLSIENYAEASPIEVETTVPPKLDKILQNTNISHVKDLLNETRRIINGNAIHDERPYMVYLKLPFKNPKYASYRRWLCGGVIVHEEYILTSAACIEDAKFFYVVSGTNKHNDEDDRHTNLCIKNGAKKAIWKCVPKNYVFDGHENDNIRWMNNDIAVVKVEDDFDFTRKVRGCDFIPKPVCYNNQTEKLEAAGTPVSIAGWGTLDRYGESDQGEHTLRETGVTILSKRRCKRRWGKRYHNIIENYMICTKDLVLDPSEQCLEKYVDCQDITYSDYSSEGMRRVLDPESLSVHSGYHNESGRRDLGGFCENDHGGPLVHGVGVNSMVIGIISACLVKDRTNKCYGPFLYTSVFRNRVLISCAIYKDSGPDCQKVFRAGESHEETHMSWIDHPDGPAKNELGDMRRAEELENAFDNTTITNEPIDITSEMSTNRITVTAEKTAKKTIDNPIQHEGVIVRSTQEEESKKQNPT